MRRSCYVSIPYGVRPTSGGGELDFDHLYHSVIRPVVEGLEMDCRRLDEYSPGAIWHKTLFTALISSDVMIADISTHNPNVLYELGVRHAMRRGRTILISAPGRLPANISYAQTLWYEPDGAGRLTGGAAEAFVESLRATIRQSQRTTISDSPLYEFFPDLQVVLTPELEGERSPRRAAPARGRRGFAQNAMESPRRAMVELQENEREVRGAPDADPVEYLKLLRKYRDLSEWDRVVALANEAPPAVASSPEVQQLLALALNRRGASGDQDRAIALMEQLVAETGGDAETFGILGRIYKDRYEQAKAKNDAGAVSENLERALQHYRAGFDKNPKDYYPGINVVTLLLQRDDDAAQTEIDAIVPRVRAAVQERRDSGRMDYWDLATDLELAVVARDWPAAERAARQVAAQTTSPWMLTTTLGNLHMVAKKLTDAGERSRLAHILGILRQADGSLEAAE